jgi:hypothetical protein
MRLEESARGIVREFLKKRVVGLEDFHKLRKGDPGKALLAGELKRSTMLMAWIARGGKLECGRLCGGHYGREV